MRFQLQLLPEECMCVIAKAPTHHYQHSIITIRLYGDKIINYFFLEHHILLINHVNKMLNKTTLGVKKCEANQKPQWLYKRPKTLISSKAKKLNILLRILSLE